MKMSGRTYHGGGLALPLLVAIGMVMLAVIFVRQFGDLTGPFAGG
jgi:hypothetical protein